MVSVGIELHIELFVMLNKFLYEFGRILKVHIIVGHPVNKKEFSFHLLHMVYWRVFIITAWIILGFSHITFGIDGVVKPPVCNRGY